MPLRDLLSIFDLRLSTPSLELRIPDDEDLAALGELAARGVHDPAVQPFGVAWTDRPAREIPVGVIQYQWHLRSLWKPGSWRLELVVFRDGVLVGAQGLGASDYAVTREVGTGSWLGLPFHGQGIGTEMRAAVLALAFRGLDADYATSSAFTNNPASNGVSRKLGYIADGVERDVIRGQLQTLQRLRLSRSDWQASAVAQSVTVRTEGLNACRDWLTGV